MTGNPRARAARIIQSKTVDIAGNTEGTRVSGNGSALAGFLVSGFLLSLLGAILPAWGYHRDPPDFVGAGNYFLSLAIGIVAAARFARPIMLLRGLSFLLVFACALSCLALALSRAGIAAAFGLVARRRIAGLGAGAGLLNLALFHAISPGYQADAAGTVNKGGILYGLGCLAATLLVAGTFYAYTRPQHPDFHGPCPRLLCRDLCAKILRRTAPRYASHAAAGISGFPQPGRGTVRAVDLLPIRQ